MLVAFWDLFVTMVNIRCCLVSPVLTQLMLFLHSLTYSVQFILFIIKTAELIKKLRVTMKRLQKNRLTCYSLTELVNETLYLLKRENVIKYAAL